MIADEQIGVRLGEASNNNTLSFNTIGGNSQLGILILNAQGNQIYLNNFVNQTVATSDASAAILNSPEKLAYAYGGINRTGYMSNYYSDYKGNDSNGTGIGSTPSSYGDKSPAGAASCELRNHYSCKCRYTHTFHIVVEWPEPEYHSDLQSKQQWNRTSRI